MTAAEPKAPPVFRRIVITLGDASLADSAVLVAGHLAQRLDAQLVGLFVEDAELLACSTLPMIRQVSTTSRAGAAITSERLAQDYAAAATIVRQRLQRVAHRLGLTTAFDVRRGNPALLAFESIKPEDLLVVVEPSDAMARLAYPFRDILRSVARSSAPILYAPHRLLERTGPVVAIAHAETDRAVGLGTEIATASGEELIVLTATGETAAAGPPAARTGRTVRTVGRLSVEAIDLALQRTSESLIVVERALLLAEKALFPVLSAERHVPTLVVGAADAGHG